MGEWISRLVNLFREYLENYRRGCKRFGIWWKLFTASMLTLALIFVSFAVILVFRFLV